MARRRRPSRVRKRPVPLRTLTLRQINARVARQRDRGSPVTLRAKLRVMRTRPRIDCRKVVLIDQFRERASPVVPQVNGFRSRSSNQLRQMRSQIVTATATKFLQEVRSPVGFVDFEAVAKD